MRNNTVSSMSCLQFVQILRKRSSALRTDGHIVREPHFFDLRDRHLQGLAAKKWSHKKLKNPPYFDLPWERLGDRIATTGSR
jgi:hypothetical protein